MKPSRDIGALIEIMAALRDPDGGCPWDLEQSFSTIAPFTIEEAYEVADAIERADMSELRDELGDLLLQVVFHARLAQEAGLFEFGDVVEAINAKLIRRHPHVFGEARALSAVEVKALWGRIKAQEKRAQQQGRLVTGAPDQSEALAGVALALPALTRAVKLQEKAGAVGFDWRDVRSVLAKLREETIEIEEALATGDKQEVAGEVGDLLFVVANLARHVRVDPEAALRGANAKFMRRFAHIEARLGEQARRPEGATLEEMDALWDEAKRNERSQT
jgi:ATP diphosphatase